MRSVLAQYLLLLGILTLLSFTALQAQDPTPPPESIVGTLAEGPLPSFEGKKNKVPKKDAPKLHLKDNVDDSSCALEDEASSIAGSGLLFLGGIAAKTTFAYATAFTSSKFDDEEPVARWDLQYNSLWYFESRLNRNLTGGSILGVSKDLDWKGNYGFQTRLTHQTFNGLATELTMEYADDQEQNVYRNATSFLTYPNINFPSTSVSIQRDAILASGQVNLLLRSNPSVFPYIGLRWWHHHDRLTMSTINPGPQWATKTRVNAPLIQIGAQFGNLHKRWSLRNRFGLGMGPSWGDSLVTVDQVVGAIPQSRADSVKFSLLLEARSEVGYACNNHLAIRAGAQLLGVTGVLRPASQIAFSNLTSGQFKLEHDNVLYSALFAGLDFQW